MARVKLPARRQTVEANKTIDDQQLTNAENEQVADNQATTVSADFTSVEYHELVGMNFDNQFEAQVADDPQHGDMAETEDPLTNEPPHDNLPQGADPETDAHKSDDETLSERMLKIGAKVDTNIDTPVIVQDVPAASQKGKMMKRTAPTELQVYTRPARACKKSKLITSPFMPIPPPKKIVKQALENANVPAKESQADPEVEPTIEAPSFNILGEFSSQ